MDVQQELIQFAKGAVFFVELLVLVGLGKLSKDKLSGYELDSELTTQDNPAVALSFAGYVFGMLVALSGVFAESPVEQLAPPTGFDEAFAYDIGNVALWGAFAVAALNASRVLIDRILLKGFGNLEELVRDRNIGVGICEAGGYVAAGLIIRAAIAGEGVWWLAPVLLVLGMVLLLLGTFVLRKLVFRRFNFIEEIEADNHAAGAMLGLHVLAIGYLVHRMLASTTFEYFIADARDAEVSTSQLMADLGMEFGFSLIYLIIGLLALVVLSFITDRLMLPKAKLQDEILQDRNVGAALVSGVVAVGGAIVVMTVF